MKNFPAPVQWVHLHSDSSFEQVEKSGTESVCKKMLRSIKGIIFDFDGTLFDNAFIAFRLIAANPLDMFLIRNERLIRSRFAGRDFSSAQNYYRAFFSEMGKINFKSPQKMQNWYLNIYMPRMVRVLKKHYKPRPKLEELLRILDKPDNPRKTAIYSDYPMLKERLDALSLPALKNIKLYGPEMFGAQKPAVRPFLEIANNLNLAPEEILVIGDREETDGLGAFNSRMHFFCLETGNKRYYRLDPNRRRPEKEPQGPTLLMYAGKWEGLVNLLLQDICYR
ncbi:MAG: HAD hydrolase-like protein [Treponema sp.]|nr:HAD hydrolase-like protein [Treponema sp.]